MRTRQSLLVLALLLTPTAARADRHNWEASAGASLVSGRSKLWGGNLSGTWVVPRNRRWGFFLDVGKHAGPHEGSSLSQFAFYGGPRRTFPLPLEHPKVPTSNTFHHLQLFAQGLGGRLKTIGVEGSDWAAGLGAGVDALFSEFGGVRVQVDHVWFWPEGGRRSFDRISLGLVYRFEDKPKDKPKH
jgi:hypothetical protein